MKHYKVCNFKDLFLLCKAHHNEVAITTKVCHSVMGWIRLIRVESIVFWNNYLLWWFPINPALPARVNCGASEQEKLCRQKWNQVLAADPAPQPSHDYWLEPVLPAWALGKLLTIYPQLVYLCMKEYDEFENCNT